MKLSEITKMLDKPDRFFTEDEWRNICRGLVKELFHAYSRYTRDVKELEIEV